MNINWPQFLNDFFFTFMQLSRTYPQRPIVIYSHFPHSSVFFYARLINSTSLTFNSKHFEFNKMKLF